MQTLESNKTSSSTKVKSGQVQAFFGPSTGTVQDNGEKVFSAGNQSDSHSFFSAHPRPVVQPKLTINEPGDQYEQEADAMAERVMRMTSAPPGGDGVPMPAGASSVPFLQRKCAACGEEEKIQRAEMEEEEPLQRKELTAGSFGGSEPIVIQRKCTACEEEEKVQRQEMEEEEPVQTKPLMRKAAGGGYTATPRLQSQLDSSKGGGNPLPGPTLTSMNQAFGADFSSVRIHTDSRAAEMSQGIQAKAFTHGADIYFNKGQYSPESSEGRRLLGHELGHILQQGKFHSIFRKESDSDFISQETIKETEPDIFDTNYMEFFWRAGIPAVINRASSMHNSIGQVSPRLQVRYAELLLEVYSNLKDMENGIDVENKSVRDNNGTLILGDDKKPWTEDRPKKVEDIAPFSLENVQGWTQVISGDSAKDVSERSEPYYFTNSTDFLSISVKIISEKDYYEDRLNYFAGLILNKFTDPKTSIEKGIEIIKRKKNLFTFFGWNLSLLEFKKYIGEYLPFSLDRNVLARISKEEEIKFEPHIQADLNIRYNKYKENEEKLQKIRDLLLNYPYTGGAWQDVTAQVLMENGSIEVFVNERTQTYNEHYKDKKPWAKKTPGEIYNGYEFFGISLWNHPDNSRQGWLYKGYIGEDQHIFHQANYNPYLSRDEILKIVVDRVAEGTKGAYLVAKWGPWIAVATIAAPVVLPAAAKVSGTAYSTAYVFTASKPVLAIEIAGYGVAKVVQIGEGGIQEFIEGVTTPEGLLQELLDFLPVWLNTRGSRGSSEKGETNTDKLDAPHKSSIRGANENELASARAGSGYSGNKNLEPNEFEPVPPKSPAPIPEPVHGIKIQEPARASEPASKVSKPVPTPEPVPQEPARASEPASKVSKPVPTTEPAPQGPALDPTTQKPESDLPKMETPVAPSKQGQGGGQKQLPAGVGETSKQQNVTLNIGGELDVLPGEIVINPGRQSMPVKKIQELNPDSTVIDARAENMPQVANESVDLIKGQKLPHSINWEEAAAEFDRVLKPGGKIDITPWAGTAGPLVDALKKRGFSIDLVIANTLVQATKPVNKTHTMPTRSVPQLTESLSGTPSNGRLKQELGASREKAVAENVNGQLAKDRKGQDLYLKDPGAGGKKQRYDVDGPDGEVIVVGGAAKSENLSHFTENLKGLMRAVKAEGKGRIVQFYYAENTPDEVIDRAKTVLGEENVKPLLK